MVSDRNNVGDILGEMLAGLSFMHKPVFLIPWKLNKSAKGCIKGSASSQYLPEWTPVVCMYELDARCPWPAFNADHCAIVNGIQIRLWPIKCAS